MPIPTTPIDLVGAPARDEVYAALLRDLVSGELAPGSRLTDDELASRTHSSRGPVREALSRLAHVGLVIVVPRRYTEVAELDDRRARESLVVQAEVVAQAVFEAVPTLSSDDVSELSALLADDDAEVLRARRALVDAFLEHAGNGEYARIEGDLGPYVERALTLSPELDRATLRRSLRALVDAAAVRDADAAVAAWLTQEALTLACFDADAPSASTAVLPSRAAVTLRDKAAATIESAILEGTLEPGETLRESELMTWLGVSRTPIREALLHLGGRGVVEVRHHRPARVATMDQATMHDALRALGVLRRLGLREALRDDRAGFVAAVRRLVDSWVDDADPAVLLGATTGFADALEHASANSVWRDAHRLLNARLRWYASHDADVLGLVDRASVRQLFTAVVDGRPSDAEQVLWALHDRVPAGNRR